jgi:hypothetical protein
MILTWGQIEVAERFNPGAKAAALKCALRDVARGIEVELESECYQKWHAEWMRGEAWDGGVTARDTRDRSKRWDAVRKTWEQADVIEEWSLLQKAINIASSAASGYMGDGDDDRKSLALRVLSCHGDFENEPCPSRRYGESIKAHYCNDCGCGERKLARISDIGSAPDAPTFADPHLKLRFRNLQCPRRRPGFSNGRSDGSAVSIVIKNEQGMGDITLLSGAIRDLHLCHPGMFRISVETWAPELFKNNPGVAYAFRKEHRPKQTNGEPLVKVECYTEEYPSWPSHFATMFHKKLGAALKVEVRPSRIGGDIHLSEEEKMLASPVAERGWSGPYWLMWAGYKSDFTTKAYPYVAFQKVVDLLRDKIKIVQVGDRSHNHKPLAGVLNLVGLLNHRQIVRAMYRADGGIGPVSFGMHLAAAVPTPKGKPKERAFVTLAGGRESVHFYKYASHRALENVGQLPCCANGGCWKFKAQTSGDFKPDCLDVVRGEPDYARCMTMIDPEKVAEAVLSYYGEDGRLLGAEA